MQCPNCGTDNPDDANFCNNCAHNLKGVSPPVQEERFTKYIPKALMTKLKESAKLGGIAGKTKWDVRKRCVIDEAKGEWNKIKTDPEIMGFLGLYWGEGSKRQKTISIVNNDPGIIKVALDVFHMLTPDCKIVLYI